MRGTDGLRTRRVGAWYSGRDPWHRRVEVRRIVDTRVIVEWRSGVFEDRRAFETIEDAEAFAASLRTDRDHEGAPADWRDGNTPGGSVIM